MEAETAVAKIATGRPLVSPIELPSDWKEIVIALYSNGASDVEVKAWIWQMRGSFSNALFDRWMRDEPEFSQTIKTGRMIAEAWYNKVGRENLQNRNFNFGGWYMQMKNRFGWRDKSEIEHSGSIETKGVNIIMPDGFKPETDPQTGTGLSVPD